MKTNRYLSFCMVVLTSALLAGMVSCKKEKGPSELRAVMNDFATSGQKAYIDQEQYSCFVVNEQVRVNNSTGTITALERNDRQCVISGVAQTTTYNAFYPAELLANKDVDLSGGLNNVAVNLPRVQVYETDANGNQIIKNPMMAELTGANENNSTLHFRNLCALLKITVRTRSAFDSIRITYTDNKLCGPGKINYSAGIIEMDNASIGKTVVLALPSTHVGTHVGTPAGECFYIMIPQINSSNSNNDFKVEILNGGSEVKKYTRSVQKIALPANQIHTIGNFTFNAPMFTVYKSGSTTRQVVFAPGNLQWSYTNGGTDVTAHSIKGGSSYDWKKGTWRFAPHQYDCIGADNANVNGVSYENYGGYSGWIDLFVWGGSGAVYSRPYPYSSSGPCYCNRATDLDKWDWGVFNTIYNPQTKTNDPYGTWRTLTKTEWEYVINNRSGWRFSNVSINFGSVTVYGLLIYPDGITSKPSGITSNLDANNTSSYFITETEYDMLDSLGCVFLPNAGRMQLTSGGNQISDVNNLGHYWTNHATATTNATCLKINKLGASPITYAEVRKTVLCSVRLARDVK